MSLSRILEQPEMKAQFKRYFEKPKNTVKMPLQAPPLTEHYGLVGMAFDYLLRFYLKFLNPQAVTTDLIAGNTVKNLNKMLSTTEKQCKITKRKPRLYPFEIENLEKIRRLSLNAQSAYINAQQQMQSFTLSGLITPELLKCCLLLAQLEIMFRHRIDENFGIIDGQDIDDLTQIFRRTNLQIFKSEGTCLLNPNFGVLSQMVYGADADLVIDDMIVDIKCTKNASIKRSDFDQLWGYYTLHRLNGIGGLGSSYPINRLAIYLARYDYLQVYQVADIISEEQFEQFLQWFVKWYFGCKLKTLVKRLHGKQTTVN